MSRVLMSMLIACAVVACGAASASAQRVRLVLDFALQGQQSPFVLAVEGGYFARAGVEVQVDRGYGSADAITKVAGGTYDMAFADIGAMIQFTGRQGGDTLVSVFQVYNVAPMVVFSLKKSGILRPADLAGKRIAAAPASSTRVMFPLLAAANGLDVSTVRWVDVTPQLRETMLVQGQADATTALITDLPGLNHLGVADGDLNQMKFSDFGVALYGHCILAKREFIDKNPNLVRAVVAGYVEALQDAIANPAVAIAAAHKRNPLQDDAVERRRLELVIANAIVTEDARRDGLGTVTPARLKQTIDTVSHTFNVPAADPAAVYRADFLPDHAALMVRK